MDNRAEVCEFLTSRRAKITPQQAGLPDIGTCVPRPVATRTTEIFTTWSGELSTRSEDFRRRWSAHNVGNPSTPRARSPTAQALDLLASSTTSHTETSTPTT